MATIRRFLYQYNPKYTTTQYTVSFVNGKVSQITEIKYPKMTSIYNKISKNTLAEIDDITTNTTRANFFESLPNGMTQGSLFKDTIVYLYSGNLLQLRAVFNNQMLSQKLSFVKDNNIYDYQEIREILTLVGDPKASYFDYLKINSTGISSYTKNLMEEYRHYCGILHNGDSTIAISNERYDIEQELVNKLTSYKEYRGVYLSKLDYLIEIKKALEAKSQKDKNKLKAPPEQMSMFPELNEESAKQLKKIHN